MRNLARGPAWRAVATILVPAAVVSGGGGPPVVASGTGQEAGPRRVLITNDDGIDHPGLRALARAFADQEFEVFVAAPAVEASGAATRFSVFAGQRSLATEERDLGRGVEAVAVDGMPADAVFWALTTWLRDRPPDLVVSGINPGTNLGDSWLASGTIGAARVAAHFGVPALAVSGVLDEDERALEAVATWVVSLAGAPAVRAMRAPSYLTVSLPRLAPDAIRGVRVVRHDRLLTRYRFERVPGSSGNGRGEAAGDEPGGAQRVIWELRPPQGGETEPTPGMDADVVRLGYIAVVAMTADEHADPSAVAVEPRDLPDWMAGGAAR